MSSDQIRFVVTELRKRGSVTDIQIQFDQALALWEIAAQLALMNEGNGLDTEK